MAMIKCKECGNDISTKAKNCPSCGAPVETGRRVLLKGMNGLLSIGLVIFVLHACNSDDVPKLTDLDRVDCNIDTMLKNPVEGQSAQDMLDECQVLSSNLSQQPTFKLLKDTATVNTAFQMKGYSKGVKYTTVRLLKMSELRGQLLSGDDAIINNYNIAFKMYNAWNGDVTPDTIYGFLSHAGPMAKTLSDKGLVEALSITRLN